MPKKSPGPVWTSLHSLSKSAVSCFRQRSTFSGKSGQCPISFLKLFKLIDLIIASRSVSVLVDKKKEAQKEMGKRRASDKKGK